MCVFSQATTKGGAYNVVCVLRCIFFVEYWPLVAPTIGLLIAMLGALGVIIPAAVVRKIYKILTQYDANQNTGYTWLP